MEGAMNTVLLVSARRPVMLKMVRACQQCGRCTIRAEETLTFSRNFDPVGLDLAVIDVGGVKTCSLGKHQLNEFPPTTSVLILVDKFSVDDEIKALRAGADAVLKTACEEDVLQARILALLRRQRTNLPLEKERVLSAGPYSLNLDRRILCGPEGECTVISNEGFAALQMLMRRPGQIITRNQLTSRCSLRSPDGVWTAASIIRTARGLLALVGDDQEPIKSTYGLGWSISVS
jgi:DNA-binding response OmpR family regulator